MMQWQAYCNDAWQEKITFLVNSPKDFDAQQTVYLCCKYDAANCQRDRWEFFSVPSSSRQIPQRIPKIELFF